MNILWYSRHKMTDEQEKDLRRIYGAGLQIKQVSGTAASWRDVVAAGQDCDVLAVVLPPTLIGDLVNPLINQKPVIRSCAKRRLVPAEKLGEEDRVFFEHDHWERVVQMKLIVEEL